MPSPFPGMNPWLEQPEVWHDFHQRFLTAVSDAISSQVAPNYYVALEEHVFIQEPPDVPQYMGRADLAVVKDRNADVEESLTATAIEAPVYTAVAEAMDVVRESFIEVRHAESDELVTVLELLSPSNKKSGTDRDAYLAKRWTLMMADRVNFIELDLLRGGPRMPIEELTPCEYYALVKRATERTRAGVWPIRLRDQLPLIPVPLRHPDPDATLDLQDVFHTVYDRAGYRYRIYRGTLRPKLVADDTKWCDSIVSQHLGESSK